MIQQYSASGRSYPCEDGGYVLYEDHAAALAAERAKVRELVECLSDVLRLPSSDMGNYQLGPGIPDWLRDEIKPLIEKYKEEPNES